MKNKLNSLQTNTLGTGPQSLVLDCGNKKDFSIQVNYGAGSGTTAKLQASNDNSNYSDVSGSSQALDNAGGSHIWNVTGFESIYCKVVLTGDAASIVIKSALPNITPI